jgi:hypothetical protein
MLSVIIADPPGTMELLVPTVNYMNKQIKKIFLEMYIF